MITSISVIAIAITARIKCLIMVDCQNIFLSDKVNQQERKLIAPLEIIFRIPQGKENEKRRRDMKTRE